MKKIDVNISGKEYPVYLGAAIFSKLLSLLDKHNLYKNIFVIVDKKVMEYHNRKINSFYEGLKTKKNIFVFESLEKNKTLNSMKLIFSKMLEENFSRDTVVVAVGGGITGDIAGFAASAFARGVQFVQVPTTLLAMVDSSVGGKTGVNFGKTKNIIGAFYQPRFVLIDSDFLKTLPEDEILCGIGEIVKTGFLTSGKLFHMNKGELNKVLRLDSRLISNIIEDCVKFKASVVVKDEKEESGLRKILNLGHTFAHALEVELKHNIKHGQAVIIGLACAFHLSNKIGLMNDEILVENLSMIVKFSEKIKLGKINPGRAFEIMKRDKKNKDEIIKFVLISSAGKIFTDMEASKQDVIYALTNGIQYFIS